MAHYPDLLEASESTSLIKTLGSLVLSLELSGCSPQKKSTNTGIFTFGFGHGIP